MLAFEANSPNPRRVPPTPKAASAGRARARIRGRTLQRVTFCGHCCWGYLFFGREFLIDFLSTSICSRVESRVSSSQAKMSSNGFLVLLFGFAFFTVSCNCLTRGVRIRRYSQIGAHVPPPLCWSLPSFSRSGVTYTCPNFPEHSRVSGGSLASKVTSHVYLMPRIEMTTIQNIGNLTKEDLSLKSMGESHQSIRREGAYLGILAAADSCCI